jgi:hypothetical protein
MGPQYATITIRRSDVPRWLPSVCGEVLLDDKRFGWLIGGQPRTIRLRAGRRVLRVRFPDGNSSLEAARPIDVEEGRSYRFECGLVAEDRSRRPSSPLVLAIATGLAGGMALVGFPLFRVPARDPSGRPYRGRPGPGRPIFRPPDSLLEFLNAYVMLLTLGGLLPTVPIPRALLARYGLRGYLGEEADNPPDEKPEDFPPGAAGGGPLDLWDPLLDTPTASGVRAGMIARST